MRGWKWAVLALILAFGGLSCGGDSDVFGPPEPIDECLEYQPVQVEDGEAALRLGEPYVVRTAEEHAELVSRIQVLYPEATPPPMPEPGMLLVGVKVGGSDCILCSQLQCLRYTGDLVTMELGVWQTDQCLPDVTFQHWVMVEDKGVHFDLALIEIPGC